MANLIEAIPLQEDNKIVQLLNNLCAPHALAFLRLDFVIRYVNLLSRYFLNQVSHSLRFDSRLVHIPPGFYLFKASINLKPLEIIAYFPHEIFFHYSIFSLISIRTLHHYFPEGAVQILIVLSVQTIR